MELERKPAFRAAPAHTVHYEQRRPEQRLLHRLVREHPETFLAEVQARIGTGLPEIPSRVKKRGFEFPIRPRIRTPSGRPLNRGCDPILDNEILRLRIPGIKTPQQAVATVLKQMNVLRAANWCRYGSCISFRKMRNHRI